MYTGLRIRSNSSKVTSSTSTATTTGNPTTTDIPFSHPTTTTTGISHSYHHHHHPKNNKKNYTTTTTTNTTNRSSAFSNTTTTTTTATTLPYYYYWTPQPPPSDYSTSSTTTTRSNKATMLRSEEGIAMMNTTTKTTTTTTSDEEETLSSSSSLSQTNNSTPQSVRIIPKLAYAELVLGRQVGQGGFSTVTAVNGIDLDEVYDTDDEQALARKDFANAVRSNKYVLKTLRNDLPEDEYNKGITDLAIEVTFLSILHHPNIIKMRAMANTDPNRSRFFLLFDRLHPTLEYKFNVWRTVVTNNTGYWIPCCFGYCGSNRIALHENWKERFVSVASIASAIEYLHSKNIIYRDLKPDNIGYDSTGTLQLFDFGLAKQINSSVIKCHVSGCEDLYMLTGNTGSLRYMAPEVALDRPYDESVDAYSFGILFWQVCSLITPYSKYTTKMHAERVVRNGERPKPDPSWPVSWVTLMKSCWSANRHDRPSFTNIRTQIEEIQFDIEQEDGVVPSKTSEIRAKKKRKKLAKDATRLDVDTRLSTNVDDTTNTRRFPNNDVV